MAVAVKKHADGYLINDKVYITSTKDIDHTYINFALQTGEAMQYGNHDISYIEYPGEYDVRGLFIKVFAGKGGELNYHVQDGERSYAFVQTEDSLANDEFIADERLFTNSHIAKALDKMEMEGNKIDLSAIE